MGKNLRFGLLVTVITLRLMTLVCSLVSKHQAKNQMVYQAVQDQNITQIPAANGVLQEV